MRIIDPQHWTADFQLARAFWEAYQEDPRDGVCVVCLGDPENGWDLPVLEVGEELRRYHPNVYGAPDEPVTQRTLHDVAASNRAMWEKALLIAVAASWGEDDAGKIRVLSGETAAAGVRPPDWERGLPPVDVPAADEAGEGGETRRGLLFTPGTTDEGADSERDADDWVLYPDVIVLPLLARPDPLGGWEAVPASARRKCRDVIIDGVLRLYSKMGYDHTRYKPGRRKRLRPRPVP